MSGGVIHQQIQQAVARWLRRPQDGPAYRSACSVVLSDLVAVTRETPDVIGWNSRPMSILVECKASRSDFLAEHKKFHRTLRGMGTRRYYAAPSGMIRPEELPEGWGLLEMGARGVSVTVEAVESEPDRKEEVLLLVSALRRTQPTTEKRG